MTKNEPVRRALVACDVFLEEIRAYPNLVSRFCTTELLEMGMHDYPDRLKQSVQAAIDSIERAFQVDQIVLAYGFCGGGTLGLKTSRAELVVPRAHDCISILLGSAQKHERLQKDSPRTYFYSPGWVREKRVPGPDREKWIREKYEARYDDDMIDEIVEADYEAYEIYNSAGYVDIVSNHAARHYCKDCCQTMNWEFKDLSGDKSWWEALLKGDFDPNRFLILKPGQTSALASGSGVIKVESR